MTSNRTPASRGFISLLATSAFGAANDNILKQIIVFMAVSGLWKGELGGGAQGLVTLLLTLPFIFLSGYAGQLADKYSKQKVVLGVKLAEVPIAIVAMIGLLTGNLWISLLSLLMLAIQSSFFGPAKFGAIPEMIDDKHLSQANGLINAISNVAVILGSLVAGPLADMYYPEAALSSQVASASGDTAGDSAGDSNANSNAETVTAANSSTDSDSTDSTVKASSLDLPEAKRWPAGVTVLIVSFLGLGAALMMPKLKPVDPNIKFSVDLLGPHIQTFRDSSRPLLVVLFSWSGFYMIGMMALLLLPEYQVILKTDFTTISYMIGLLAIAITIGSLSAGFLSGKTIRPYFTLLGAGSMTICFLILGLANINLTGLAILIFLIGFSAGFYIIPLQSLLQYLSPSDERGRFFGTANALSFVFTSSACLVYWGLTGPVGMPPARVPLVCAGLAFVGTSVGAFELNRIMAEHKSLRIQLDHADETPEENSSSEESEA